MWDNPGASSVHCAHTAPGGAALTIYAEIRDAAYSALRYCVKRPDGQTI